MSAFVTPEQHQYWLITTVSAINFIKHLDCNHFFLLEIINTHSGHPILSSLLELLAKEKCDFSNPLWRKLSLELQSSSSNRKPSPAELQIIRRSRRRSMVMKRARLDRCIRPINAIERKLRILKKLIPNSEYMGVESLFREAADYIVALQMRAKAMQIMVDVLSASADE